MFVMTTKEFEQWVHDGIIGPLAKAENIPAAALAQARQAIAFAAKDPQIWRIPKDAVAAVAHGTLRGLMLLDQNLTDVAVPLMRNLLEAAQDCALDPAETIGGALEGIAQIAALLPVETQNDIRERIDEAFMDTGAAFIDLLHQASTR